MGFSVRGTVLFGALAACTVAAPASAQTPSRAGISGGGVPPTAAPPAAAPPRASDPGVRLALEGPLDADTYVVGPGDVFTVAVGGTVPRQVAATVSADGRLVIPEAGNFVAAGKSLERVRGEVLAALRQRYQNVTADLALSAPRLFYVHVSGSVPQPGRHLVPAVARVEDAIVEASGAGIYALAQYGNGVSQPGPRWPALRSITVTSRTGRERSVDLMRYVATGEIAANPYLQDGDAVNVPTFNPLVEGVLVGGAVDRAGTYDVRAGDTAADLLVVTSGRDPSARIARVRRVRPQASGAAEVREAAYADAASLDVRPRDQVYAVAAVPEADRARVDGAVRYPGTYPITEGETTVDALVAMAGGLREDALVRATTLERPPRQTAVRATSVIGTDETTAVGTGGTVSSDVSVDSDLLGGLFSRQFFASQTGQTPRVALDPEQALAGRQAVPVRGGDILTVPFNDGLVRVYGRVQRGGLVPFVPGAAAQDYVARAGGPGPTAAEVYVVDATTGQLVEGGATEVRPGDAVFVNSLPSPNTPEFAQLALQERQDARQDASDRRTARFQAIQTVLSVVGTVASLIIAYSALNP